MKQNCLNKIFTAGRIYLSTLCILADILVSKNLTHQILMMIDWFLTVCQIIMGYFIVQS